MTHESLLYYIAFLQVADIATTGYLLKMPGHMEANPIVRWLMDKIGFWTGLIGPKVVILVALFMAPTYSVILYALAAFYTAVVVNNSYLTYRAYRGENND